MTLLLKACYNWNPGDLGQSPYADEYYTSILNSNHGFTLRTSFSQAQLGDILACKYSNGGDTGHVMIFSSSRLLSYDPATQTREYEVTVMDCSKEQHTNDTRSMYSQLPKGAGTGQIRVKTVNDGLIAWAWRVTDSYYAPSARPIVLGFFTPN